jgi:hypothetical protein
LYDRGCRYPNARVGDQGIAVARNVGGNLVLDVLFMKEAREGAAVCQRHMVRASGNTAITATPAVIVFDTLMIDEGGVWLFDDSAGTITMVGEGIVRMTAEVSVEDVTPAPPWPNIDAIVEVYVTKNGSEITGTRQFQTFTAQHQKRSMSLRWTESLIAGDVIAVEIENTGSTTDWNLRTIADSTILELDKGCGDVVTIDPLLQDLGCVYDFTTSAGSTYAAENSGCAAVEAGDPGYTAGGPDGTGNHVCFTTGVDKWLKYPGGAFAFDLNHMTAIHWVKAPHGSSINLIEKYSNSTTENAIEWSLSTNDGGHFYTVAINTYDKDDAFIAGAVWDSDADTWLDDAWNQVAFYFKRVPSGFGGHNLDVGISVDGGAWSSHEFTAVSGKAFFTGENRETLQSTGKYMMNQTPAATGGENGLAAYCLDNIRFYDRVIEEADLVSHYDGGDGLNYPFV